MKRNAWSLFVILFTIAACSENRINAQGGEMKKQRVGGDCEGCEAIYESTVPFERLRYSDTLPGFRDDGPKLLIHGTVFKPDGKTPAPGIVLYVYQTDQNGQYPKKGNESGWAKRHGYIRTWLRTNEKGEYRLTTLKPASYPGSTIPAHIHIIIKEPGINEYYIDDFQFDDDPFLTATERARQRNQGGDGILKTTKAGGLLVAERNIILGKNITNYPARRATGIINKHNLANEVSGLEINEDCPAFDPKHVSGADAGKQVCPMCKYGAGQGMMIWWNKTSLEEIRKILEVLDDKISNSGTKRLRVFVVFMNPERKPLAEVEKYLETFSRNHKLRHVAITYIPSPDDPQTARLYKINPSVQHTILIYKYRKVIDKFTSYDFNLGSGMLTAKL